MIIFSRLHPNQHLNQFADIFSELQHNWLHFFFVRDLIIVEDISYTGCNRDDIEHICFSILQDCIESTKVDDILSIFWIFLLFFTCLFGSLTVVDDSGDSVHIMAILIIIIKKIERGNNRIENVLNIKVLDCKIYFTDLILALFIKAPLIQFRLIFIVEILLEAGPEGSNSPNHIIYTLLTGLIDVLQPILASRWYFRH